MKRLLVIAFLASLYPAIAALPTTSVWEVRTAGSNTNGGGFDSTGTGTDMSQFNNANASGCTSCQSTSANLSTTDAIAAGTTTITSASAAFTSAITGNIVYFQGGSGTITAQWRRATYVSATSITIDVAIAASTGMTMNIGGALLTPQQAYTNSVAGGNTVWLQSGTYTFTSALSVTLINTTGPWALRGYHATRGDHDGTRPLITTSTTSINLIETGAGNPAGYWFDNIQFEHTGATRGDAIHAKGSVAFNVHVSYCLFGNGTSNAASPASAVNGNYVDYLIDGLLVENSEIAYPTGTQGNSSAGIVNDGNTVVRGVYIHHGASAAIGISTGANGPSQLTVINCVLYHNVVGVWSWSSTSSNVKTISVFNTVIDANTGDGIEYSGATDYTFLATSNNIIYGNGGYGIDLNHVGSVISIVNNAYGSNTSGNYNNASGTGDVALTGNPFNGDTSVDFTLNNTSGAGAACRNAGQPGTWGWASSKTGYADIGAYRHQDPSGGGSSTYPIGQ